MVLMLPLKALCGAAPLISESVQVTILVLGL